MSCDRLLIVLDGPRCYSKGRGLAKVTKQGWWTHPSLNAWVNKSHHFVRAALNREWNAQVGKVCAGLPLIRGQVIVTVWTFIPTDRDADPDNYTPKFILDGLVHAGVIEGDSRRIVVDLRSRIRLDREDPRTEIEIRKPTALECEELLVPAEQIRLTGVASG